MKRTSITVAMTPPRPATGAYHYAFSPQGTSTSNTQGNGTLRLAPWALYKSLPIDRIGAEIATVGEAGSKLRLGIYADNGNCYPGSLVLDAGQIAGDSANVQELTVSLTLQPGLYWVGGVVQSASTTQPTVRVNSNWTPPVPIPTLAIPSANFTAAGVQQSAVTTTLPSTFTTTVTATQTIPRVFVRAA